MRHEDGNAGHTLYFLFGMLLCALCIRTLLRCYSATLLLCYSAVCTYYCVASSGSHVGPPVDSLFRVTHLCTSLHMAGPGPPLALGPSPP